MADNLKGRQLPVLSWVSWAKDPLFLLVVGIVFSADQISKAVVRNNLLPGESVPDQGFFRFTHTSNTGSAFGLFPDQTIFLILASFVGIGILILVYRSHGFSSILLRLSLGLQLGGAFGNLVDRVRMGKVTDFIDVGSWPIFNIADTSIVVGIILLIILFVSSDSKKESTKSIGAPYGGTISPSMVHPGPYPEPYSDQRMVANPHDEGRGGSLTICPVCESDMNVVPGGWRCSGCGVMEHLEVGE